jgi:putative exporter of polyketide antibiotics
MSEYQNPLLCEDITHLRRSRSKEESGIIEIVLAVSVSDASKNSRF